MVGVILSRLDLEIRLCFIGQLILSGLELILLFCCDGSTKTGGSIVQLCCIIGYSGPSDSVALSDRMLVLFDISYPFDAIFANGIISRIIHVVTLLIDIFLCCKSNLCVLYFYYIIWLLIIDTVVHISFLAVLISVYSL